MIICLDGIDQCGKNTQVELLKQKLNPAVVLNSPDDSTFEGHLVREYLAKRWAPVSLPDPNYFYKHGGAIIQCVYATEKFMKIPEIENLAAKGVNVILNRWFPSAYAYSLADGTSEEWLLRLMHCTIMPHANILLDIDPSDSVKRKNIGRDVYESKPDYFRTEVRNNYLKLFKEVGPKEFPQSEWYVLDGRKSIEDVAQDIWSLVSLDNGYESVTL